MGICPLQPDVGNANDIHAFGPEGFALELAPNIADGRNALASRLGGRSFLDPRQINFELGRNDGQMVFYDQVVPGSTLMGYVNADHWAIALPIARSHERIGSWFATENAYPREALAEAIMRFVEEDLAGKAD